MQKFQSSHIIYEASLKFPLPLWCARRQHVQYFYIMDRHFAKYNYNIHKHSGFILPAAQISDATPPVHLNTKQSTAFIVYMTMNTLFIVSMRIGRLLLWKYENTLKLKGYKNKNISNKNKTPNEKTGNSNCCRIWCVLCSATSFNLWKIVIRMQLQNFYIC